MRMPHHGARKVRASRRSSVLPPDVWAACSASGRVSIGPFQLPTGWPGATTKGGRGPRGARVGGGGVGGGGGGCGRRGVLVLSFATNPSERHRPALRRPLGTLSLDERRR